MTDDPVFTASTARMIGADRDWQSAPILRREITLATRHGPLIHAELLATALGVLEATINGLPVSEDVLTPGWSSYEWRLRFARWDVTDLLEPTSVLGITIGHGWHSGRLGFTGARAVYGDERAAFAELHLRYDDGFEETVVTDDTWRSGPSAVLQDDLYDGETIDARRLDDRWTRPGAALEGWGGVRTLEFDVARLTPYIAPPVRRHESLTPRRIWTSPGGSTLLDFGQNLVGWITMTVQGERGQEITVRHAEVLEHDELGVRPLRTARATDRFILSGGTDVFEPTFTFHGFRYVQVDGWTTGHEALLASTRAVVVGSALRRTGTFECSDPLLNQLHQNVIWGMRGNFLDVPTDCPQRDERLGWTGDLAAFAPTSAFLFDVKDFLRDWLHDLAAEQEHADGAIPVVVPDNIKYEQLDEFAAAMHDTGASVIALWNDAACWVPWALWQAYGDRQALGEQYGSMVDYTRRIAGALSERGLLETGFQLGDWLDPDAPPDEPHRAKADGNVIATACVFRSVTIVAAAARVLGHDSDVAEFEAPGGRIRSAFTEHYVKDGVVMSDATAVYALAIGFGLLHAADREAAGDRLAELVREARYRVTTGFAGTPFITGALADTGHLDDAYRLLLERECPSWLYPITMGATTVWERWDSMLPDGSINPGEMTSFNHYAFGAVADWMHTTIAGIAPAEPGYRSILFSPRPGGGLTWASATLETPQGRAAIRWSVEGDVLVVDAEVPEGSTAVLRLPGADDRVLDPGSHRVVGR